MTQMPGAGGVLLTCEACNGNVGLFGYSTLGNFALVGMP